MTRSFWQWASSQSKDLVLISRWVKSLWRFQATEWPYQSSCGPWKRRVGDQAEGSLCLIIYYAQLRGMIFSPLTFLLDVSGQGSLIFFGLFISKTHYLLLSMKNLIFYCSKPEVWLRDLWAPVSIQGSGKTVVLVKTKQNLKKELRYVYHKFSFSSKVK